jgi:hypothetical protein
LKHPGFSDAVSLLCLGSKAPDMEELFRLSTTSKKVRLYHVINLQDFNAAYIGGFFKARVYPEEATLTFTPRAFHAIIITDWPASIRKVQACLEEIILF